jgi:O-antigen/teichoic acid export membrane protein
MKNQEIIKDASVYTASSYLFQAISFLTGFITRGLLGPEDTGIWNLFIIILGYLPIFQLGTIDAVGKEIPYLKAKNNFDKANRYKDIAFSVSLFSALIISFGLILYIVIQKQKISEKLTLGLLVMAFVFPIWQLLNCQTVMYRADKKFILLGKTLAYEGLLNLTLMLLLVWRFRLFGMYFFFIIKIFLIIFFWIMVSKDDKPLRFSVVFNWFEWKQLLKIGLPLSVTGLIYTFFMSMDSILIAKELGIVSLGYYSIALSVRQQIFIIPNSFSIVMFPRFQEKYGVTSDKSSLKNYIVTPVIAFSFFIMPVIIGSAYIIIPVLVKHFLPKFAPGILPLKILLGGIFFISLTHMSDQFLITICKQIHNLFLLLITLIIGVTLIFIAVKMNYGITGVAAATAIGYFIKFVVGNTYAMSHITNLGEINKFILKVCGAFIYSAMVLLFIDNCISLVSEQALVDLFYAVAKTGIYMLALIPLFWSADRQTGVISRIKKQLLKITKAEKCK